MTGTYDFGVGIGRRRLETVATHSHMMINIDFRVGIHQFGCTDKVFSISTRKP